MKRKLNKKHLIEAIVSFVTFMILLWGVASYIDVVIHNNRFDDGYRNYASWNVFTFFEDGE